MLGHPEGCMKSNDYDLFVVLYTAVPVPNRPAPGINHLETIRSELPVRSRHVAQPPLGQAAQLGHSPQPGLLPPRPILPQ